MAEKKLPKGIRKRQNGLYEANFKVNGQRYTFYNRDLDALKKTVEDKRYEIKNGLYHKETTITVDQWFHTWLNTYKTNIKMNTTQTYKYVYEELIKGDFAKKKIKEVTANMVQIKLNTLDKQGYATGRINMVYVIFSGMFKQAYRLEMISKNPMDAVVMPRKRDCNKDKTDKALTEEQQALFFKYAEDSRYYDFYRFAICTGCRIGEIQALRWQDIDFENSLIHINGTLIQMRETGERIIDSPKTSSSRREIDMLPQLILLLKRRKKNQDNNKRMLQDKWKEEAGLDNLVFTYEDGGALWADSIRRDIRSITARIRKEEGIDFPRVTPHTFRHTFATRGLETGFDLKTMQKILGHSSLAITADTYSHVLPNKRRIEMEKLIGVV